MAKEKHSDRGSGFAKWRKIRHKQDRAKERELLEHYEKGDITEEELHTQIPEKRVKDLKWDYDIAKEW